MKTQHTPGPWKFNSLKFGWSITGSNGRKINIFPTSPDGTLITAAPDLLAILIHVIPQLENDVREAEGAKDSLEFERATERLETAQAAIAKEEGK